MRTIALFCILLIVIIVGCFLVSPGKILLTAGTIIFGMLSIPTFLIGLSQKEILPTCLGIGLISMSVGCVIWLSYLCEVANV